MRLNIIFFFLFLPFVVLAKNKVPKSIYDFKVMGLNGKTINFAKFKGKKILIVNTPSMADNHRDYAEIEAAYQKYKDKMVVIGFLDDDYGPPPGSKREVDYSTKNYHVTFPLAARVIVKGSEMTPIYKWLTQSRYNKYKDTEVKWDFQKYLINEKGVLVAEFDPKVKMTTPEVVAAIEK